MKRITCLILLLLPFAGLAWEGEDLTEKYFTGSDPILTRQEKEALRIGNKWRAASASGVKPVAGTDGTVQFVFGDTQPSIVCAPLQVCDIELQSGEVISNFHVGDMVRWRIEPARSGSGEGEIEHIIIKPLDVGLRTSMIITTNRRTYYIGLVSHRTDYMPRVSFQYPDDTAHKWKGFQKENESRLFDKTETEAPGSLLLKNLSFEYTIDGDASFRPDRVFNDGNKTFLEMPKNLHQGEAPTLLVIRGEDGILPWGKKAEEVIVNYRVQGNRYVVDSIPDQLILIAGAGDFQSKVVITKGAAP
jgi:type IV secretion system protein VirB9